MEMECKRSGQIPVFGDWDNANDLPITQYFECARQAGLIRHSLEENVTDLYTVDFQKPQLYYYNPNVPHRKTKAALNNKKRYPVLEQKWTGKVEKASGPQKQFTTMKSTGRATATQRPTKAKPVDEDLYKVPPHLLPGYKRKKMFGFFSRCLAPPCKA